MKFSNEKLYDFLCDELMVGKLFFVFFLNNLFILFVMTFILKMVKKKFFNHSNFL